jgi:glycosyltransferase involved in cell wall biosynthesis
VLTPVHAASSQYLDAARDSVLSQQLPLGWKLEWLVQEDGGAQGSDVPNRLRGDDRIKYASNGAQLGAAMTRNLALARAAGEYLQNLDSDDVLLPNALSTLIAAIDSSSSVHWAFGQADDLMPDGSRQSFPPWIPPFGLLKAGRLNDWVAEHEGNWPIPCAGIMYRTATLRAVGGWAGLPIGEDIALLAALSQITDGWQDETITWLYRQHPDQISRHALQPQWSETARLVAVQRAKAAQLTDLRLSGGGVDAAPLGGVGPAMKTPAALPGTEPGG